MGLRSICLGIRLQQGPWGGGNKSVTALHERLIEENFEIADTLSDDVKIIFCFDPRPDNTGLWYGDFLNHKFKPKVPRPRPAGHFTSEFDAR